MTLAIPDYQSLMLPVLRLSSDGGEHRMSDVVDTLANHLKLTEAEREATDFQQQGTLGKDISRPSQATPIHSARSFQNHRTRSVCFGGKRRTDRRQVSKCLSKNKLNRLSHL